MSTANALTALVAQAPTRKEVGATRALQTTSHHTSVIITSYSQPLSLLVIKQLLSTTLGLVFNKKGPKTPKSSTMIKSFPPLENAQKRDFWGGGVGVEAEIGSYKSFAN